MAGAAGEASYSVVTKSSAVLKMAVFKEAPDPPIVIAMRMRMTLEEVRL